MQCCPKCKRMTYSYSYDEKRFRCCHLDCRYAEPQRFQASADRTQTMSAPSLKRRRA